MVQGPFYEWIQKANNIGILEKTIKMGRLGRATKTLKIETNI